jgi:hypothetical protein
VHLRGADTSTPCWTTTAHHLGSPESLRITSPRGTFVVLCNETCVSACWHPRVLPTRVAPFAEAVLCALIKHNITVTLDLLRRQKTIDPCIKPSRMACGSRRNLTNLPVQYALFSESWCAGSVAASTLQPGLLFNLPPATDPPAPTDFRGLLARELSALLFLHLGRDPTLLCQTRLAAAPAGSGKNRRLPFSGGEFEKKNLKNNPHHDALSVLWLHSSSKNLDTRRFIGHRRPTPPTTHRAGALSLSFWCNKQTYCLANLFT